MLFFSGELVKESLETEAGLYLSKVVFTQPYTLVIQLCTAESKQREAMQREREAQDNEKMVR